jgi:DNA polymerase III alpha subunit
MNALFSDLPEVIANTVEIAKRCNVHFDHQRDIKLQTQFNTKV